MDEMRFDHQSRLECHGQCRGRDSTSASELNEIVSTDAAVDLDYDQMSSMSGSPGNELTYAPRHRLKK